MFLVPWGFFETLPFKGWKWNLKDYKLILCTFCIMDQQVNYFFFFKIIKPETLWSNQKKECWIGVKDYSNLMSEPLYVQNIGIIFDLEWKANQTKK